MLSSNGVGIDQHGLAHHDERTTRSIDARDRTFHQVVEVDAICRAVAGTVAMTVILTT